MIRVPLRSQTGISTGDAVLDPTMFEAQVNVPVMHQVVVAQANARRAGTRGTKTRGNVRGGGSKPYRQKGTGRARQGSIRAPHYAGGGTVWGPHPRDFSQKVPRKMRFLALRSALSDRARLERILVFDDLTFEVPKTKEAAALLREVGVEGKVLLVLHETDENVIRAFRNLPEVHILRVDQLNTYDVLARDWLVLTREALERINARGASSSESAPASAGGAA